MDRNLLIAAAVAFSLPGLADPGTHDTGAPAAEPAAAGPAAEDSTDSETPLDEFWPGMWLWNSENKPAVHLGPSTISEAWTGPAAYLRHHDAGVRESAARWLRALGEHARPAMGDLLAVLDDETEEVRSAAEDALARIDPGWWTRPADELEALAAEAPGYVKIEGSISAYGFPLRGRQAIFPLEAVAGFGIEVTIDGWWGRPRPAAVGLAVGDTVVFGVADAERFAGAHFGGSDVAELEGVALTLILVPLPRAGGLWSFDLERAEVFDVYRF